MRRSLISLTTALALLAPAAAIAQPVPPHAPKIIVSGEGESATAPDMAIVSLGVMREAATAREALDANSAAMAAVIAALKAEQIAERDLQTAGLQIMPRYTYANKPDGSQEAQLVGYQVTNTISVRVRDIGKTGLVIDKAVALGVNQGGSIAFVNEDPKETLKEARRKAVEDARAKAETLAEAAGVSIARVLEISEQSYAPTPMPISARAFDKVEAAAVPVQPGENSYRVQVTLTYELR